MNNYSEDYYDWVEKQLKTAIGICNIYLTEEDIVEVKEKIHNKEYGIALQALCYRFVANKIQIPSDASEIIHELIFKMGMKDKKDEDYWFWIEVKPFLMKKKGTPI